MNNKGGLPSSAFIRTRPLMRTKSKKPLRNKATALPLDRPFAPEVLDRAKELAFEYRLILEPNEELGFMGRSIEMPYVWGDGRTPDACVHETREAIISSIATMLEMGEVPPSPASEKLRQEQINIRVTPEEKFMLEEAARSRGFRGISDFVRSTTLNSLR